MIHFRDLVHKNGYITQERLAVMLYQDVQVNPMFTTRSECLAELTPTEQAQTLSLRYSTKNVLVEILLYNLHDQRARIDSLQISPRHL